MKWRKGLPDKSGMYICHIKMVERGLTFMPVSYVRFDNHLKKWKEVDSHFSHGEIVEWLDEESGESIVDEDLISVQIKALKQATDKACISKEAALKYLQDAGIIESDPSPYERGWNDHIDFIEIAPIVDSGKEDAFLKMLKDQAFNLSMHARVPGDSPGEKAIYQHLASEYGMLAAKYEKHLKSNPIQTGDKEQVTALEVVKRAYEESMKINFDNPDDVKNFHVANEMQGILAVYLDGGIELWKRYFRSNPPEIEVIKTDNGIVSNIHFQEEECVAGCKSFTGGEIKHHKNCPFYPQSLTRMYDEMETELAKLKSYPISEEEIKEAARLFGWKGDGSITLSDAFKIGAKFIQSKSTEKAYTKEDMINFSFEVCQHIKDNILFNRTAKDLDELLIKYNKSK